VPVLALYFAVAGSFAFTAFVLQTARATLRALTDPSGAGVGGLAVSAFFLVTFAAIDTAFVVLLLRTLLISTHAPPLAG
jgi:hypothetical protein